MVPNFLYANIILLLITRTTMITIWMIIIVLKNGNYYCIKN